MADKKDLDSNPPAEDGTIRFPLKKRATPERSLTGFDRAAHEPEFKKQKLEQLQRKAYHSVLLASKSETSSGTSSHSRTLIMQDLLNECNKAHIKKIVEPRSRLLPEDIYFRPTDLEMAIFLKQKALGQPIEAPCIIPEERHDIFSIPPRDLPGYPEETHWYYYCRKPKGQDPRSLWTRFRENTAVLDEEEENCVGIKRRFTIVEKEEECNDIFLADEEVPPVEEWFLEEISLPSSVADTDLVLCHVVLEKREKTKEEEEEYYDEEEEEEEE